MPPSPYTSIEVLLAIFESYMHNCTTTSIEALLPMSKYYIYKQAIPSSKCGVASKPMIWSFNRATKWRWKQVMDLSVSQRLRQPWVRLWESAMVRIMGEIFYLGKMGEIVTISTFSLRRHQDCWHLSHLSKPFQPCFKSGNLVMGTSISWTSPALPLLQKPEEVKLWTGPKIEMIFFIGVKKNIEMVTKKKKIPGRGLLLVSLRIKLGEIR